MDCIAAKQQSLDTLLYACSEVGDAKERLCYNERSRSRAPAATCRCQQRYDSGQYPFASTCPPPQPVQHKSASLMFIPEQVHHESTGSMSIRDPVQPASAGPMEECVMQHESAHPPSPALRPVIPMLRPGTPLFPLDLVTAHPSVLAGKMCPTCGVRA